jgi:hypothetical protein
MRGQAKTVEVAKRHGRYSAGTAVPIRWVLPVPGPQTRPQTRSAVDGPTRSTDSSVEAAAAIVTITYAQLGPEVIPLPRCPPGKLNGNGSRPGYQRLIRTFPVLPGPAFARHGWPPPKAFARHIAAGAGLFW